MVMAEKESRTPEPAPKAGSGIFDRGREPARQSAEPAAAPATGPTGQQQVVVTGQPLAAATAPPRDPPHPYTGPTSIIPGGAYVRGAQQRGDRHYGGEVVDAHGNRLAVFDPDQINTGDPRDGRKPEDEG